VICVRYPTELRGENPGNSLAEEMVGHSVLRYFLCIVHRNEETQNDKKCDKYTTYCWASTVEIASPNTPEDCYGGYLELRENLGF